MRMLPSPAVPTNHGKDNERVIAVPFLVTSGKVIVEGREGTKTERNVRRPPGDYRLAAAQSVTGEEEESIDLSFELLAKPL